VGAGLLVLPAWFLEVDWGVDIQKGNMSEWIRVTKANPCPVCGKDSWCLISFDGETGLCMRVANDHPKQFRSGEVAYIHRLSGAPVVERRKKPEIPKRAEIDAESLIDGWLARTKPAWIAELASKLGVKASALLELNVAWAGQYAAFAFPMRDGYGRIVGVRLRNEDGRKWSVKGSRSGLFLPYCQPEPHILVVEGATDTLAARSLNLFAVGRPSCSGGLFELKTLFERLGTKRITIIADNDKPGLDGAQALVRNIQIPCCVINLPCKDLREFVNSEGTAEMIETITQSVIWQNQQTTQASGHSGHHGHNKEQ
jgi:hypothetical protein